MCPPVHPDSWGALFCFPSPLGRHEKHRPSCLGRRPEGSGLVVMAYRGVGCVLEGGGRGKRASASQGPADTNTRIQERLDPSSPSTGLRNARLDYFLFLFLQEMKRSSVPSASNPLALPPLFPQILSLHRTERGKEGEGVGQDCRLLLKCLKLR